MPRTTLAFLPISDHVGGTLTEASALEAHLLAAGFLASIVYKIFSGYC